LNIVIGNYLKSENVKLLARKVSKKGNFFMIRVEIPLAQVFPWDLSDQRLSRKPLVLQVRERKRYQQIRRQQLQRCSLVFF